MACHGGRRSGQMKMRLTGNVKEVDICVFACVQAPATELINDRSCLSTQLNEHVRTQVLTPQCPHLFNTTTYETTHLLLHVLIYSTQLNRELRTQVSDTS